MRSHHFEFPTKQFSGPSPADRYVMSYEVKSIEKPQNGCKRTIYFWLEDMFGLECIQRDSIEGPERKLMAGSV